MRKYSVLKRKTPRSSPFRPVKGRPDGSIKELAVLFTDIVGSSKYFKSFGDLAGRNMLKRHQDMASTPINEHGGAVVKMLGDSVMAYFMSPAEALKAAIKIQKKFYRYNQGKDPMKQIHIRICIHFGTGIVEENDIFGDVVNMAAKVLSMVKGDQIFISQSVYEHVLGLPSLRFKEAGKSGKGDILTGFSIYKVIWEEAIILEPQADILLYLKPAWKLGGKNLEKIWGGLIGEKKVLWTDKVKKEVLLTDKSIVLILEKVSSSIALARDVMEYISMNLRKNGAGLLPLQIIIDSGQFFMGDKLATEKIKVDWEEIAPGDIHISLSAYDTIKNNHNYSIIPSPDKNKPQPFYKLIPGDHGRNEPALFLYQNALVQGKYPPCYYCGDKRHLAMNCPSKMLPEITHGLERLGYLQLEEINKLFFNYLTETGSNPDMGLTDGERQGDPFQWAHYGFYELKMVFQLRFLRTIWDASEENWNKIKKWEVSGEKGGSIWIGQDCIRVSNLDQAESILKNALEMFPNDFRVYCAYGFLNVEKNNFSMAKRYFKMALGNARTRPQNIFTLFLISRIHDLNRDPLRTRENIRKILHIDPYCPEAIYQDILIKFKDGKKAEAIRKLVKLIKNNREYYVCALIDPELADFNELIHPKLVTLLEDAGKEAEEIAQKAEGEIERLVDLLGEDEKEVKELRSLWLKIEELSKNNSYFCFLDIIDHSYSIIKMAHRGTEGWRRKLSKIQEGLADRIDVYHSFIRDFPYGYLTGSVSGQLAVIRPKINDIIKIESSNAPEKLKKAFTRAMELSKGLDRIEMKLKRLDTFRNIISFVGGFFKGVFIYQSINLTIALLLFPIICYYLNFLMPGIKITQQSIWTYQKGILIVGGISGIFLAMVISIQRMSIKGRL